MSLVPCSGYHRAAACLGLCREYVAKNEKGGGTARPDGPPFANNKKACVDVLYLGPFDYPTFLNASVALNHGNRSTNPTNFLDQLIMVSSLRYASALWALHAGRTGGTR